MAGLEIDGWRTVTLVVSDQSFSTTAGSNAWTVIQKHIILEQADLKSVCLFHYYKRCNQKDTYVDPCNTDCK